MELGLPCSFRISEAERARDFCSCLGHQRMINPSGSKLTARTLRRVRYCPNCVRKTENGIRLLSDTKRNYEIHDKEMLAIMRALDEWRHCKGTFQSPFLFPLQSPPTSFRRLPQFFSVLVRGLSVSLSSLNLQLVASALSHASVDLPVNF